MSDSAAAVVDFDVETSLEKNMNSTLTNTYDVLITVAIFGPTCILLTLLFVVLRRYSYRVFSPRTIVLEEDARPTPFPKTFFSWIPLLFKTDFDDSVLTNVGMDSYVYLRVLRLGTILCLVAAPLHLLVLGPLYASHGAVEGKDLDFLQSISLSNVQADAPGAEISYGVACAFVFLFTFFGMGLLRHEYRNFTKIRQSRHGSPRSYTALVERLPKHLRTEPALRTYFESVFPGTVARVDLVPSSETLKDLGWLVGRRDELVMKLERAKLDSAEGKPEATHLQFDLADAEEREEEEGKEKAVCGIPLASRACCYGRLPHILTRSGTWVKSVEYYSNALEAVEARLGPVREKAIRVSLNDNIDPDDNNNNSDKTLDLKKPPASPSTSTSASEGEHGPAPVIFSTPLDELDREEALRLLGDEETIPRALAFSAAFVTFNSLLPRTIASECNLDAHSQMLTFPSPASKDVIFENLGVTQGQRAVLRVLVDAVGLLLLLGFGVFTSVISATTNLGFIRLRWDELDGYLEDREWLVPLFNLIAPLLLVIIFSISTPVLFNLLRLTFPRSWSDLDHSFYVRYLGFLVLQIFLFFQISGALFVLLGQIYENPRELIFLLARTIPSNATFFLQFVLTRLLWVLPLELLRVSDVAVAWLVRPLLCGRSRTLRERRSAPCAMFSLEFPGDAWHAKNIATNMLMVFMAVTYSVMAPVMLLVCGIYLGGVLVVYRHHLKFVYVNAYDSDGALWAPIYWSFVSAFLLLHLTMLGMFALSDAYANSVMMLVLMAFTLVYAQYLFGKYNYASRFTPLRVAAVWDHINKQQALDKGEDPASIETNNSDDKEDGFSHPLFREETDTDKVDYGLSEADATAAGLHEVEVETDVEVAGAGGDKVPPYGGVSQRELYVAAELSHVSNT